MHHAFSPRKNPRYRGYPRFIFCDEIENKKLTEEKQALINANRTLAAAGVAQNRKEIDENVAKIKEICDRKGWTWEKKPADDNLYHYMVNINGITHRIIQWSDP